MLRGNMERGATAVEYALIVVLAAVLLIGAVRVLGDGLSQNFNRQGDNIENSVPTG